MTRTVLALSLALLARAALGAAPALPGLAGDAELTADHVTYEPASGRVALEGNAVVRRGAAVLRARSADYDPATGEVRASGGVLLTDPTRVISADAVRAVLGDGFEAQGVLAFVKDQPVDLSEARAAEEAGRTGRNRLRFSTPSLRGDAAGRLRLSGARLTLCDCPGGAPPSWEITAREADVVPGDRAILHWPVLRIAPPFASRTVPVLVLPWLYLPLGDRQSGLLVPTVGSTGASGFTVAQPLYLTLGRSADATLAPEYAFGRKASQVRAGKPSVRGPGARLELRWAPAEGAEGRAELAWMDDLDAEPGGAGGNRGALVLAHAQRTGATSLQVGLRLAGDPVWVRDTTSDVLAQATPYRRSDALLSRRGAAVVAEAAASYLQPLDPVAVGSGGAAAPFTPPGAPWGTLGSDRRVASRLGAASATLVPLAAGPLRLSGRLGVARFGTAQGLAAREVDVAGRDSTTRADARAEVGAPILLARAVTLAPFVRGAALGYAPGGGGEASRAGAWGVAGASVETELSRGFGALRHVVAPRLAWRAGTDVAGDPPRVAAYDQYDRAGVGLLSATPGAFQQLRASLETRLEGARGTALRLELGQDADLRARRFAEAFGSLSLAAGPLAADAGVRFFSFDGRPVAAPPPRLASPLDRLSELHASVGVQDGRGDSLRAGFLSVGPGGSGRLVAGLDPLFDVRAARLDAAASATLAVRANLGAGARIGYDALLPGRAAYVPSCADPAAERRVTALQVQQHSGSLSWDSPCRCFRITMSARVDDCGGYGYHASIDLARLGSGGGAAPR